MSQLAGIPDLSKYVRRKDKINVFNSVSLIIDNTVIDVNGLVLSRKSPVLEQLVCSQSEISLDNGGHFTGEKEGVQDCIELLYGGLVEISDCNINTITKFSALYQVNEMFELCVGWIEKNLHRGNLFKTIELGTLPLIEFMTPGDNAVLDMCRKRIAEDVKDGLFALSQTWEFKKNNNFIRFLIQKEILYYTLPILSSWVECEADVGLVLDELMIKDLTLSQHKNRADELLERMSEKMDSMETSRRILKLQISNKEETALASYGYTAPTQEAAPPPVYYPSASERKVTTLLAKDHQTFTFAKILTLEDDYGLDHHQYVDIALDWIMKHEPSASDINKFWGTVMQHKLEYSFILCLRDTILFLHPRAALLSYELPEVEKLGIRNYQYLDKVMCITASKWVRWLPFHISADQITQLLTKQTVNFRLLCHSERSEDKKLMCDATLRLEDRSPCCIIPNDSHCEIKHWYIQYRDETTFKFCYYSLLTNSYDDVIAKIKERMDAGYYIALRCLYKCRLTNDGAMLEVIKDVD